MREFFAKFFSSLSRGEIEEPSNPAIDHRVFSIDADSYKKLRDLLNGEMFHCGGRLYILNEDKTIACQITTRKDDSAQTVPIVANIASDEQFGGVNKCFNYAEETLARVVIDSSLVWAVISFLGSTGANHAVSVRNLSIESPDTNIYASDGMSISAVGRDGTLYKFVIAGMRA